MYIVKNALKSISRNKGRNILIGLIFIVIAASCTITLSIRNAADKIVKSYEEKYEVKATIGMNRQNLVNSFKDGDKSQEDMINSFNDIDSITTQEIDDYGKSKYVKSYYYVYNLGMNSSNISSATDSLVKETTTTKTETFEGRGDMPGFGGGEHKTTTTKTEEIKNMKSSSGEFTLLGYNSYESMTDFIEGTYTITEGSVSSDFTSDTCVISEELALLNELSIGDTITFTSPNNAKKTYDLEVTGIYTENNENDDMANMFSASANNIITNSTVIENILEIDEDLTVTITPTFILTSSDVADNFAEEVSEKGLSKYYTVTNNLDEVESATKSITNVKTFATTFLTITLIIGGVVLLVINMINIRERKYEIGVLRTIGMSKLKVVTEFVIELLIVATLSLLIGAFVGSLCSVNVANSLLQDEINNSNESMQNVDKNFGGGMIEFDKNNKINGLVQVEKIDTINAVVDMKVVLQLLLIGIGLTLVSSISACVGVARFSPLTILKERS